MKPGGVFICVSHGNPTVRSRFMTLSGTAPWRVDVVRLGKPKFPFLTADLFETSLNKERIERMKARKENPFAVRSAEDE